MLAEKINKQLDFSIDEIGKKAKNAAVRARKASTKEKNNALIEISKAIEKNRSQLIKANNQDVSLAQENGLDSALIDRLQLTNERIDSMISGVEQISRLTDPVGQISELNTQPSGIKVGRMRIPLGVIGIIYESRPNVTVDAAALCLKSGNVAILRGGSEAFYSNQLLYDCIHQGLNNSELDNHTIQIIETTDRNAVGEMLLADQYIDVIIPRGGRSLIERVAKQSKIPVIKHLDGNCHVYIDDQADYDKAINVAFNAKARRYGICGAMETLLVSEVVSETVLPTLINKYQDKGIELRGCEKTVKFDSAIKVANNDDWYEEFHGPILAIRVVQGLDEAIEHINRYGSSHTDSIITENIGHANRFLVEIDSSSVMVNTSTQFADGFEYGLGAEIGISTNKLHVYGPVGLEGLTAQKYIVIGDGHVRP